MKNLQSALDLKKVKSRFLTIGFTSYHNAELLGSIARAGSETGNFVYVDTNLQGYDEKITSALTNSLEMALKKDGLHLMI